MSQRSDSGREFLEDYMPGEQIKHSLSRTVLAADNAWFTLLTMNSNPIHFDREYAKTTQFKRPLVNSCLTLSIVTGLSVRDVSERAIANLGWDGVRLPNPVFEGDTLSAKSEVIQIRPSATRPSVGIVQLKTTGVNQRGEVVIEFQRSIMVPRRTAPETRKNRS